MDSLISRQQVITDSNKSPLIEVMAYMTLSISVLSLAARIGTKCIQVGSLRLDDYFVTAAVAVAIGQSIALLIQCQSGWGRHFVEVDPEKADTVFKAAYAADVLFVASLGLGKAAFAMTARSLAQAARKRLLTWCQYLIATWTFTGLLIALFACALPRPWDYLVGQCVNRSMFWTCFNVFNIITDMAVIGVTLDAARRIQTVWAKRIIVMGVFGSRLILIPAIVAQIVLSIRPLSSRDPTFELWPANIAIEVVQCLNIVTASVPVLKPFIDGLESGQFRADLMRRQGKSGYGYNSDRGVYGSNMHSGGQAQQPSAIWSQPSNGFELDNMPKSKQETVATTLITHEPGNSWDGQSSVSQKGLIQQTRTWGVEIERRGSISPPSRKTHEF